MKIKIITCHDVYNVGASLQAYALVTYLRKLGHDAKIIDYKPDYLSSHYRIWGGVNPKYDKPFIREVYCLAKLPGRLKGRMSRRKKEFDHFKKNYLPCTQVRYTSNEDLKKNPPKADVYFAGSDQIWNTLFQNGRDSAFYLDFVPKGNIKASYAGSFATKEVVMGWREQVESWLSGLDYISVRESSGLDILQTLGISDGVQVLDPVFLLERQHWEILCEPMVFSEKYILLYDFDNNEQLDSQAKHFAEKNGLKLYSVLRNQYADRYFSEYGPRLFLSLVKNAECVISNSFHATAFSIIFEKNFWVCRRNEGINTRMQDLVKLIGLENRLITGLENLLDIDINYKNVNKKMSSEITNSRLFIEEVLKGYV